jgi:hypothetical protein
MSWERESLDTAAPHREHESRLYRVRANQKTARCFLAVPGLAVLAMFGITSPVALRTNQVPSCDWRCNERQQQSVLS